MLLTGLQRTNRDAPTEVSINRTMKLLILLVYVQINTQTLSYVIMISALYTYIDVYERYLAVFFPAIFFQFLLKSRMPVFGQIYK